MKANRGKSFEISVKQALLKVQGVSVDRLADPMAGFKGLKNICDFIVYKYPNLYYLECKSIRGNTLNFKSDITDTQWSGLHDKSSIYGAFSGILVWYIDHDVTYFVPIRYLQYLKNMGFKSLNIKDVEKSTNCLKIQAKKKRVFFDYDFNSFFDYYGGGVKV